MSELGGPAEQSGGEGPIQDTTASGAGEHVARDLFPCPLPFPDREPVELGRVCRSVERRLRRRLHWRAWCNDGVAALNEIYGSTSDSSRIGRSSDLGLSEGQRACMSHVTSAYALVGAPPFEVTPAGAFEELCGTAAGYSQSVAENVGCRSPFVEGKASIPSAGSRPADPCNILQGEDLLCWKEWQTRILIPHFEAEERKALSSVKKPYSDPVLTRNHAAFGRFVKSLLDAGVVTLGEHAKHTVGLFFVTKKSGALRLIFDTRIANA